MVIVDAPLKEELAVAVKQESMRCHQSAVVSGGLLALVPRIGEWIRPVPGALNHVVEGIRRVRLRIVGIDQDEPHALRLKLPAELDHAPLPGLDIRAVIAPKGHYEPSAIGKILEPIRSTVDPGKFEVRGLGTGSKLKAAEFGHRSGNTRAHIGVREVRTLGKWTAIMPEGNPLSRFLDRPMTSVESLERDEELLRTGEFAIRVAQLTDRAISLGAGQRETEALEHRAWESGLPVHRRPSGGLGLLLLPGDIVWSIVVPRRAAGPSPTRSYGRFGAGAIRFLTTYGVLAEWVDAWDLSPHYCLLGSRGEVLTGNGRALGGAAQHMTRTGLLHHGVLIARRRDTMLAQLFDLSENMIASRLTSLEELGIPYEESRTPEILMEALATTPETIAGP